MTNPTDTALLDLAERVEKLTGECSETNADIWDLVGPVEAVQIHWTQAPNYTGSLDAALTLVPEGWRMEQIAWSPDANSALICASCGNFGIGADYKSGIGESVRDVTAVLAAALRARAQVTG